MTRKDDIDRLQGILVRRREALARALEGDMNLLAELRTEGVGEIDAVDQAHDQIGAELVEVETKELRKVESAIRRINNGTFGSCEDCGSTIPIARLNALPYATRCISCQRTHESG